MARKLRYSQEEMRTYMRTYREQRLAEAKRILGGCCVACGTTENLEFDHKNPANKTGNPNKMLHHSKSKFFAEVAKCQLLCKTCHSKKSQVEGDLGQLLTTAQVQELRAMYATKKWTQMQLAAHFGISQTCVSDITRRRTRALA